MRTPWAQGLEVMAGMSSTSFMAPGESGLTFDHILGHFKAGWAVEESGDGRRVA